MHEHARPGFTVAAEDGARAMSAPLLVLGLIVAAYGNAGLIPARAGMIETAIRSISAQFDPGDTVAPSQPARPDQPGTAGASTPATDRRAVFRSVALESCRNPSAGDRNTLEQAGIAVDLFCACAIDRYMRKATDARIDPASETPEASRILQEAAVHCVGEMMRPAADARR